MAVRTTDKHLDALRALLGQFRNRSGDEIIAEMIPELAALVVILTESLERAHRWLVILTWVLVILTLPLVIVDAVQLYVTLETH